MKRVALVTVLIAVCVVWGLLNRAGKGAAPTQQIVESPKPPDNPFANQFANQFAPRSPAQLLADAKRRSGFKHTDLFDLEGAQKEIENIPREAPEYAEGQKLLPGLAMTIKVAKVDAEVDAHPIEVTRSTWMKGGFDAVALWTVTFRNKSKRPVGNITYRTAYYGETDTQVDKGGVDSMLGDHTIRKIIKPKSLRTIEINDGFVHSEAVRAHFELVAWEFLN